MRYPKFLSQNERIGFIAPSFGCAGLEPYYSRFQSALLYFRAMGYKTVCGPNVFLDKGIGKSNTPSECGLEINDFFLDDRSDIIISASGGETMCEDLDHVDFMKIASAKPIWFMGYSDNTNLTFTLPTLCDTAAIYGPCASSFGMLPRHRYLEDAFSLLKGENLVFHNYKAWEKENPEEDVNPTATLNATEPFCLKVYKNGVPANEKSTEFSGRLLGGCLDILLCLCGTKYDKVKTFTEKYKDDGIIWFLEACDLNPLAIIRGLWQLKNAGWFDTARGFLIGRSLHYTEEIMGTNCLKAYVDTLKDFDVPLVLDLDIGHLHPQMPIISGAIGHVKVNGNSITLEHELR